MLHIRYNQILCMGGGNILIFSVLRFTFKHGYYFVSK